MRKIKNKGIVSLGAVLILGAVIVEVALVSSVLVYLLNFTNFGIRLSAEAFAGAAGGIEEGLMRVIRQDYVDDPSVPGTGNAGATIKICKDFTGGSNGACGSEAAPGKYEIISVGQALSKKRQLVAVASVDPITGLVAIQSIEEKPL